MVPRLPLFEGTIAENIALNDPSADDISIIGAASIACARIYHGTTTRICTRVAEKGSNLSGGQRQECDS